MGARRQGRELAVQALYQLEVGGDRTGSDLELFWRHFEASDDARAFAHVLVEGVQRQRTRIDQLIADAAEHWRLPRLSKVDASILRLATCEFLDCPNVPARVTIDEAIEVAKRFGSRESAAFVNGILDRIAEVLGVKRKGDDARTEPE
jgi:N utilization substance protein B